MDSARTSRGLSGMLQEEASYVSIFYHKNKKEGTMELYDNNNLTHPINRFRNTSSAYYRIKEPHCTLKLLL